MINITPGISGNLLVAAGHGKVTADDYKRELVPAIRTALKRHEKICLLYQLGNDFLKFTARAIWEDAVRCLIPMFGEGGVEYHGTYFDFPPRNVLPKPRQKPQLVP